MPTELPQSFPEPDRDDLVAQYRRDAAFYADEPALAQEGSQADIDGKVLADQLVPGYQMIKRGSDNLSMLDAEGDALVTWCEAKGIPGPQDATPSLGFVVVQTAKGGTTVFPGDELKYASQVRYRVVLQATVTSGQLVLAQAVDTGPSTNLPAGAALEWSSPRPGCLQDATVGPDGLTGGRLAETDPEVRTRLVQAGADPESEDDNDAKMRGVVMRAARSLGIPVQAVFSYPAILGPGTTCFVFTVYPDAPGGSRLPTAAQRSLVEARAKQLLPGDDSIFVATLANQDATLALRVAWRQGATPWADLTPWPAPYTGIDAITVTAASSPTSFTLGRVSGMYVGLPQPKAGQTIAFYHRSAGRFVRKRIASVVGTGPWAITVDTTGDVSDTGYTPVVGRRCSPWSDSLQLLVAPLLAEFDQLGPGEQTALFFDEGRRERRSPPTELDWPSRLSNRAINGVQDLASVLDARLIDPLPGSLPQQVAVGSAGALSYLFFCRDLAVFPL